MAPGSGGGAGGGAGGGGSATSSGVAAAAAAALGAADDRDVALGKGALDLLGCDAGGLGEGVGLDAREGRAQHLLVAEAVGQLAAAGKQGVGLLLREGCGFGGLGIAV